MNKKILIMGTFDKFHNGHINLISKAVEIYGERNLVVSISTDRWNLIKNKPTFDSQYLRAKNIRKFYQKLQIVFEDSISNYSDINRICEDYKIGVIFGGDDHRNHKEEILNSLSPNLRDEMAFHFIDRYPNISSSQIRNNELWKFNKNNKAIAIAYKIWHLDFKNSLLFIKLNNIELITSTINDKIVFLFEGLIFKKFFKENYVDFIKKETLILNFEGLYFFAFENVLIYEKKVGTDFKNKKIDKNNYLSICKKISKLHSYTKNLSKIDSNYITNGNISQIISFSQNANKFLKLDGSEIKYLLKTLEYFKDINEFVLCHADLNPGNIIVNENVFSLIDFEYIKLTNIEWDIASLLIHNEFDGEVLTYILDFFNIKVENYSMARILLLYYDSYQNLKLISTNYHDMAVYQEKIEYGKKLLLIFKKELKEFYGYKS